MKKYLVFSLLALMVLSACNLPGQSTKATEVVLDVNSTQNPVSEATPPPAPAFNDSCGNPYYPVVNGAEWNYTGPSGPFSHSIATGSEGAFTINVESADSKFVLQGLCLEGGDLNLLQAPGNSLTYEGESGGSALKTISNEGITLPGDIQIGDDWSQTLGMEAITSDGKTGYILENSYKAIGYETITVPAGTFYALKVEMESILGGSYPLKQTDWYVQDVGLVKSVIDLGTPVVEELVTYSIPSE
jgi:hypothetical protein